MSKTNPLRPVRYFTDSDGMHCALVPLPNGDHATIYADDYARIIEGGASSNWQLNYNGSPRNNRGYVKAELPGRDLRTVARLVMQTRYAQQVKYRDGNPLNLRRSNLVVVSGGKAHKDCKDLPSTRDVAAEGGGE
jgi:hypothetical protein